MIITFAQIEEWAALKPPVGLSAKALMAWRRFAPVELDGVKIAFPAKAAFEWLKSTGGQSLTIDDVILNGTFVRGKVNNSRISLTAYTSAIPCEEPWNPTNTTACAGGALRERCEWGDMVKGDKTSSTPEERKAFNFAKRLEKAKGDYVKAKQKLDEQSKRANEAEETMTQPLSEAVKQARVYLSILRARRVAENNPTLFPPWMPATCERDVWDSVVQKSKTEIVETKVIHAELVVEFNAAVKARDEYKPRKTPWGAPKYGPRWDKLNEVVTRKRQDLERFNDNQFGKYLEANGLPSGLRWGTIPNHYSRARRFLKTWPGVYADLDSQVKEAAARLNKIEAGWEYWQKDKAASWIRESDEEQTNKARALGAICYRMVE